jgi:competence protein ComEC
LSEQWLRADAAPRGVKDARGGARCEQSGCAASLPDGRTVALVLTRDALLEDCTRATLLIAPFPVPTGCAAATIIDRRRLDQTGAMTLKVSGDQFEIRAARAIGENRPWSRPPRTFGRVRSNAPPPPEQATRAEEPQASDTLD